MSTIKKPKIYLAGPLTGLSYDDAQDWRLQAIRLLEDYVDCFNPMRGCDFLRGSKKLQATSEQHKGIMMSTNKNVLVRDRTDCITSDALLIYFPPGCAPSIGTSQEAAWAHLLHKPIVAIAEEVNIHRQHAMLTEQCVWADTLEEGCEMIKSILCSK